LLKGECFGLLGPNGAGKTTLISILTGLYPPTDGYAWVDGYDVHTEMDYIHRNIGVCPQHDILWDDLTCVEHLLFYARLKGVPKNEEMNQVEKILKEVGLSDSATKQANELSGGMRRRLSIAISLVGDSPILFLDEPTTGLDPETRRYLWTTIQNAKVGRCIILTTHSMEEADVLSTKIAIMSNGSLKCLGNQLHLKNKFGGGYKLTVSADDLAHLETIEKLVKEIIPSATLTSTIATTQVYHVEKKNTSISKLFADMESKKQDYGIEDWGISQTTLEEVFLKIVQIDESDS